jgi:hypothetical protein
MILALANHFLSLLMAASGRPGQLFDPALQQKRAWLRQLARD